MTVPVAAEGETVAVSVTVAPATAEVVETASDVLVEVVVACQKPPQPARNVANAIVSVISANPEL